MLDMLEERLKNVEATSRRAISNAASSDAAARTSRNNAILLIGGGELVHNVFGERVDNAGRGERSTCPIDMLSVGKKTKKGGQNSALLKKSKMIVLLENDESRTSRHGAVAEPNGTVPAPGTFPNPGIRNFSGYVRKNPDG